MNESRELFFEKRFQELEAIECVEKRKQIIFRDIKRKQPRYKTTAQYNPWKLFKLLGGKKEDIWRDSNWAYEYTFDDYYQEMLEAGEIVEDEWDFDGTKKEWKRFRKQQEKELAEIEANWDLEEKSIERAHEIGHWFVTGTCVIEGEGGIELPFEFEYCEGYLHGVAATPYNVPEGGGVYGIPFS